MIHKISYKVGLGLEQNYFDLKTSAKAEDYPVAVRYSDNNQVFKVAVQSDLESEAVKIIESKTTKRLTKIYANSTNILITDIVVNGKPCFWKWPKTLLNTTVTADGTAPVTEDGDFLYFTSPNASRLDFRGADGSLIKTIENVDFHRVFLLKDYTHLAYIYEKDKKYFTFKKDGNRLVLTVNSSDVVFQPSDTSVLAVSMQTRDPVNQRSVSYWPFLKGDFDYTAVSPNTTRTTAKRQLLSEDLKINLRAMNIVLDTVQIKIKLLSDNSLVTTLDPDDLVNGFNPQISEFDLTRTDVALDSIMHYAELTYDSVSYKNQFALFDYKASGIIDFDEESEKIYNCHLFFTKESGIVFRAVVDNKIINSSSNQVILGSRYYGYSEGGYSEDGFSGIVPENKKKEYFLKAAIELSLEIEDEYIQSDHYIAKNLDVGYDTIIFNTKAAVPVLPAQYVLEKSAKFLNFRQGTIVNFGLEAQDLSSLLPANNLYYFIQPELEVLAYDLSDTEIKFNIASLMQCVDTDTGLVDEDLVIDAGHSLFTTTQVFDNLIVDTYDDLSLDITNFILLGDGEVVDAGSYQVRISSDLQFIHYKFNTTKAAQHYKLYIGNSLSSYQTNG